MVYSQLLNLISMIKKLIKKFSNMDLKDVFKEIYLKKMWCSENEKSNFKFYSGLGSYYPEFVSKYLEETSSFLRFNLKVKKELVLCETRSESIIDFKGVIKTQLLHLY